jgi:hypothetical protein
MNDDKPTPVRVFCSYSHRDNAHRLDLEPTLKILRRQGLIDVWHDGQLIAGEEWRKVIDEQIHDADIVLLLVSRFFLASDFCMDQEFEQAMNRFEQCEVRIIPIILSVSGWQNIEALAKLQALPSGGKAIESWPSAAEAYFDIEQGLRQVALEVRNRKNSKVLSSVSQVQQQQSEMMDVLRLILPVVIPSEGRIHLQNLLAGTTDGYEGRRTLRRELRQLRSMQLIAMVGGHRVADISDGMKINLQDYAQLTDMGKFWMGRVKEIEGLDGVDQAEDAALP